MIFNRLMLLQDFILMFGEDVSGKLPERWQTTIKKNIIQRCWKLPSNSRLKEHLLAADPPENPTEADLDFCKQFVLLHSNLKYINMCKPLHISIVYEAGLRFKSKPQRHWNVWLSLTLQICWCCRFGQWLVLQMHLIPPSAQGCKKTGKVSASQPKKHFVAFKKVGIFP